MPLLAFNLKRGAWPAAARAAHWGSSGGEAAAARGGAGGPMSAPEAALVAALRRALDPAGEAAWAALDLGGPARPHDGGSGYQNADPAVAGAVAAFVQSGVAASRGRNSARALPDWALSPDAAVFLNIPMDAETPSMRLLRPQALVQEEAIRHWCVGRWLGWTGLGWVLAWTRLGLGCALVRAVCFRIPHQWHNK